MKARGFATLSLLLVCLSFSSSTNGILAQLRIDNIRPVIPNDPGYREQWGAVLGLPGGYGMQDWIEANTPQRVQPVVILLADGSGRCDHPDLAEACLMQYAMNFIGEPYADNNLHGTGMASAMLAKVNNRMAAASPGGYRGRIQFVPDKVLTSQNFASSISLRAAYQHAYDLKTRDGLNVIAVVTSVTT